jgi:L-asparaginase
MSTGTGDALLRASLKRGARGLVLEGTGCGNVPPGAVPGIRAALGAKVPVVLTSRCPEGRLAPAYGYEGGGQMLRELGVVYAQELAGQKARIKLMVALGAGSDLAGVRRLFE